MLRNIFSTSPVSSSWVIRRSPSVNSFHSKQGNYPTRASLRADHVQWKSRLDLRHTTASSYWLERPLLDFPLRIPIPDLSLPGTVASLRAHSSHAWTPSHSSWVDNPAAGPYLCARGSRSALVPTIDHCALVSADRVLYPILALCERGLLHSIRDPCLELWR